MLHSLIILPYGQMLQFLTLSVNSDVLTFVPHSFIQVRWIFFFRQQTKKSWTVFVWTTVIHEMWNAAPVILNRAQACLWQILWQQPCGKSNLCGWPKVFFFFDIFDLWSDREAARLLMFGAINQAPSKRSSNDGRPGRSWPKSKTAWEALM